MGEAKRRGTFEQRKAQAIAEGRDKEVIAQRKIRTLKLMKEAKSGLVCVSR